MYARHGRTPPQICDACAWDRIVEALSDDGGTRTAQYDVPPAERRPAEVTHTTIGGRGVVGRIKR